MGVWKDQSVFVTGANGFVGSALVERLAEEGARVTILVRDRDSRRGVAYNTEIIWGSVTDEDLMRRVLSSHQIQHVFHLAALSTVKGCHEDPVGAFDNNVMGTVRLLNACRQSPNIKSVIVSSSDKAYGNNEVPYYEDLPLLGIDPYPASKVCEDIAARMFAHAYRLPVGVIRSVNVYGPGDYETTRLIPNTIRRLLQGQPAQIYDDADKQKRQFVYIDDEVEAYLTVSNVIANGDWPFHGDAFNVGGANGAISIKDMVATIGAVMGFEETPMEVKSRIGGFQEISEQYINDTYLRRFQWEPKVPLVEGLQRTIDWWKENLS